MRQLRPLLIFLALVAAVVAAPFLWLSGRMAMGPKAPSRRRPAPFDMPTAQDLDRAETKAGIGFPEGLRQFYLEGRNAGRPPCGRFYSLKQAVAEYRMLTGRPYGPNGEDWPKSLFPIADLLHGYAAFDLATGMVVEWDPEEIAGGNESKAAWKRSFVATGKGLDAYLAG